jgi:hypothetical protein
MGRRNASTFKKRQREIQKKEKKASKIQDRKIRRGELPDEAPAEAHDPFAPRIPTPTEAPAVIRLSDLTLPSKDED